MAENGLYDKYTITKTDGSPVDENAVYFVLRLDTDRHAQQAISAYIHSVQWENPQLADDLIALLRKVQSQ